jgi:group I intron endonuclease
MYIGQTINIKRREYTHKHYLKNNKHANEHLQNSYNKYGHDCFVFEILDQCVFSWSADNLERFWIRFYKSDDRKFGFNKDSGGNSKKQVSKETRLILSKINKENPTKPMLGKKHSELSKQKMMKKKHSYETKKRMSEMAKKKTGEKNPFYGKKHTEIFKQNLSNKKKMPIICTTNGKEYDCAKSASLDLGINQSYITHTCAGKFKSAKGYAFKYKFLGLK